MCRLYFNLFVELILIVVALVCIFGSQFILGVLIFILIEIREHNYRESGGKSI